MIRLFIFTVVRFLIAALAFYVVLSLIRFVVRILRGQSKYPSHYSDSQKPSKPTENYTDVKDANFVEFQDEQKDENSNDRI